MKNKDTPRSILKHILKTLLSILIAIVLGLIGIMVAIEMDNRNFPDFIEPEYTIEIYEA